MKSKVTTAPASEPVTLTELKSSLRITNTAEDTLLTQYISDARMFAENYTGKKFISQTVTSYYDANTRSYRGMSDLVDDFWDGMREGAISQVAGSPDIELEFAPAISVTSIDTIDVDNSETTYSSSNYYLDNFDESLRPAIVFNDGESINDTGMRISNSIKIVYVAGYGASASDVPHELRRAIIMLAGALWANRGVECSTQQCGEDCGTNKILEHFKNHGI